MKDLAVVILAAGKGKRMRSSLPKVLHRVCGQSLISFPQRLAHGLGAARTVIVVGHGRELVEAEVRRAPGGDSVKLAVQEQQLGTGHAVMAALPALRGHKGPVLILSGDVPLLDRPSVTRLARAYNRVGGPLAFCSFCPSDPAGYGRVLRAGKRVVSIREHRDCSKAERAVGECNAGIYLVDIGFLRRAVRGLDRDNSQGELYLTDLIATAAARGVVPAVEIDEDVVGGVNDRADLADVEAILRYRRADALMRSGVTLRQPETVHVDLGVKVGRDSELGPGVQLLGTTTVGKGCLVETGAVITDSKVADGAVVKAYSVLESAEVGPAAEVGPFGRLRPGAVLRRGAKVGNFVELKNTVLGEGSKANHLAYLGDGHIGTGVNVGAGTIFCNYDGFLKHRTVLEDGVFIGSDSQLVAPVTVGSGAYVASGSTVTRDVPADALAIARSRQENKPRLAAALRRTLAARKKKAQKKKGKK